MKKLFLLLFILAPTLYSAPVNTLSVSLAWDIPTIVLTNQSVYRLYLGYSHTNYTTNVIIPLNVFTNKIIGLLPGTNYYFAVTASITNQFGTTIESDYSTELIFTTPSIPSTPLNLRIIGQ